MLQIEDLSVSFATSAGLIPAVDGVSLQVRAGQTLGIVGESGSGKSVTVMTMLGLVRGRGVVTSGRVMHRGRDVFALSAADLRSYRGGQVAAVLQDPMNSLNPVRRLGQQFAEAMSVHGRFTGAQARSRTLELLDLVGIPDPGRQVRNYPHEFSGGMRQRLMIALAMANEPEVIIADEPTTALDVTVQAQVLELFARLNREFGTAIVLVSHNLGTVVDLCERVLVMYGGHVVEELPATAVLAGGRHPYTRALVRSVPSFQTDRARLLPVIAGQPPDPRRRPAGCPFTPRCPRAVDRCADERPPAVPLGSSLRIECWNPEPEALAGPVAIRTQDDGETVAEGRTASTPEAGEPSARPSGWPADGGAPVAEVRAAVRHFPVRGGLFGRARGSVHAVDGVDLVLGHGEALGIVGESGCGKSTLARLIVDADRPDSGEVFWAGRSVTELPRSSARRARRSVQMLFQNSLGSMDPRFTVGDLVAEPMVVHRLEQDTGLRRQRVADLLRTVGLDPSVAGRYPRDFSGGQRQRIAIARALSTEPDIIVCDEPVSSLDVSLQAQVVNLLTQLQADLGLSYVFISHDLALVRYLADRVAVMYLGQVVEEGPTEEVCALPMHPYTASLVSAVATTDPDRTSGRRERIILRGELPSPTAPPAGCRFHTRCPIGPLRHPERTVCIEQSPPLTDVGPGRRAACHFAGELSLTAPEPRPRDVSVAGGAPDESARAAR